MKIPLFNIRAQYEDARHEIDGAIKKVVREHDFVLGSEVRGLEDEIAAYCGARFAVGVASGTDALILSLMALGIKEGDEVITTPFTFFATAESVSLVGAKPVFVDIDPKTYNINPSLIEGKITSRTRAIIPVHLYGQCADMDGIMAIAKQRGLKVIEDNAQALGARYKEKMSGSIGHAAALSFFPSKNLGAFGDAGMITTNDGCIAERIKILRVHGSSVRYVHSEIGTNSRLDNIQAAVLRVKLKCFNRWLKARVKNAEYYDRKLRDLPVECPYVPPCNTHTYHLYVLRMRSGTAVNIIDFLNKNGVESRPYYPIPLHLQECYKDLGYKKGDLPEAEKASVETFAIPMHPKLTMAQKDYVVKTIRRFFER